MSTDVSVLDLRALNVDIGVAEKEHDVAFLAGLLHDDLVFRRADGGIVGKTEYLEAVAGRVYDMLETEVSEVEPRDASTVVTAIVKASGTANGSPFGGTFRNVRTFVGGEGAWRCTAWVNTRLGLGAKTIHHVSLTVTDLERSRCFYREVLGLREIERPPFDFPGAWFGLGANQLHLIVGEHSTFRGVKGVDSRDVHFALRVPSYFEAKQFLESKGYSTEADALDPMRLKASPGATAGFPQLYILDPDGHVIEINAEKLDTEHVT